jgi:hypothetical protein
MERVAGVAAAAAIAVVLALSAVVLVIGRWPFGGSADCTASQGGRSVGLSADEAEAVATVGAGAVRRGLTLATATTGIEKVLDVSTADARLVASAVTGRSPQALTCEQGGAADTESDKLDRLGLTARAERVRRDVEQVFGHQQLGGYAPGGVRTGHMVGSAHYEGRAVDIFFRPVNAKQRQRGWAMAAYLVAHAQRLEINTVIFDARIWTAQRADQGWRDYVVSTKGRSARTVAILEHRDHVHVDVAD